MLTTATRLHVFLYSVHLLEGIWLNQEGNAVHNEHWLFNCCLLFSTRLRNEIKLYSSKEEIFIWLNKKSLGVIFQIRRMWFKSDVSLQLQFFIFNGLFKMFEFITFMKQFWKTISGTVWFKKTLLKHLQ